jgi:hypothetical protein
MIFTLGDTPFSDVHMPVVLILFMVGNLNFQSLAGL